jgi:HAD superfamily hydrolase (TIGR01509 family)
MQVEALLFDVDGTLADTERDGHRVAFNRAFADAGLDWHWDEELYGELLAVTGGKARMRRYVDTYLPEFVPPGGSASELDEYIAGLHRAKTRHYTRLVQEEGLPLRPGVRRLLEEARSGGLRLAIATTTTPANVSALLEKNLGSGDWFELIAAGDAVPNLKPAPDVYFYALARMGLSADRCLAVEDSENGLRAARGAGVATLVTVNAYTQSQDFSGALLVVDQLGEPDRPFRVLEGDAHGCEYVDLELIRRL